MIDKETEERILEACSSQEFRNLYGDYLDKTQKQFEIDSKAEFCKWTYENKTNIMYITECYKKNARRMGFDEETINTIFESEHLT